MWFPSNNADCGGSTKGKYRRIAKTPRPLLYLEFEYNSRKIAKNILCYLVKLEYNLRKFI